MLSSGILIDRHYLMAGDSSRAAKHFCWSAKRGWIAGLCDLFNNRNVGPVIR